MLLRNKKCFTLCLTLSSTEAEDSVEAACFAHVAAPSEYVLHKGLMNKQIWYREAVHLVKRG